MGVANDEEPDVPLFEVENNNVIVRLYFDPLVKNQLNLADFYNLSDKRGLARCTLFFMLKRMIIHGLITKNTTIHIPLIEPNTLKNATTYSNIGFNIERTKQKRYISVEPYQTVENFIKILEKWCNDDEEDQKSYKRQQNLFGGKKYKHKGREYVVHIGPQGGRYIIIKNVKKYI